MSEYWEDYTCDKCDKPFTKQEWDRRETPHHTDCPNYDPDGDEFTECTCDRNYHARCWSWTKPDPEIAERCQSTSHERGACHGVLWECEQCHKTVCCADGTDSKEGYNLCDACWAEKYGSAL